MGKNIVILGAGFGGLRTAIELAKKHDEFSDYTIILIDKNSEHAFTPLVYEVATGYFEHENWRSEHTLAGGTEITVSKIIELSCHNCVQFVVGEVVGIDIEKRKVVLRDASEIQYEYLVLGMGAESDYFGIEGLRACAIPLKTVQDAVAIRKKIKEFIKNKSLRKSVQLQIAVGGGGATGVEFAAELAYYFRHVVQEGELRDGDYEINLIEAGPRLIPFAPAAASIFAYDRLTKLGVKVLLDTCIKKAESFVRGKTASPNQSERFGAGMIGGTLIVAPRPLRPGENPDALLCSMAPGDEDKISFDLLVWAGGIRGNALLAGSGFAVDLKGRVAINEYGEIKNMPRIFALGDCANFTDEASRKVAPALAQVAIEQGSVIAAKILHDILGLRTRTYRLRAYPTVLPMGGKHALFIYKNFYTNDIIGWFIHAASSLRYFISVLKFKEGLRAWLRGAWMYSKND